MSKKGIGTFVAGAAIGAGIALLFAPQDGKKTRAQLKAKLDDIIENAKDIDIKKKALEIKDEISKLDKEKVASIAKETGKKVVEKADELVSLAKEKAEPKVEKAAKEIKAKASTTLRNAADKIDGSAKTTKNKKSTK